MGTFLTDTFTGANGTELKLHTGELGACWNQPNVSASALATGSAIITSNRLRGNSTGAVCYLASAVPADRDMNFSTVLRCASVAGNSPWIGLRMDVRGTSGYRFGYDVGSGHWQFQNANAGAWSCDGQIDFAQSLSAGVDYTLAVTIDKQGSGVDNISLTIDGGTAHTAIGSLTVIGCPAVMFDAAGTASTNTTGIHIDSLTFTQAAAGPSFANTWAFVGIGDSLSADNDSPGIPTLSQYMSGAAGLNTDRYWNLAWSGQTVVNQNDLYATQVAPLYALTAGYTNRLAYIFTISNDVAGGADAATILANLQTLHGSARATGFKTVACTLPYNIVYTAAQNLVRATMNASIRSGFASWADYLSDLDLLWQTRNPYNSTYYLTTGSPTNVHWTATLHSVAGLQSAQDIRRQKVVGATGRLVSIYP